VWTPYGRAGAINLTATLQSAKRSGYMVVSGVENDDDHRRQPAAAVSLTASNSTESSDWQDEFRRPAWRSNPRRPVSIFGQLGCCGRSAADCKK
jgi:hypothetical protein